MSKRGVRGIRVNFVSPQPWGRTDADRLVATSRIAADLGWHIQIYAKADQIAARRRGDRRSANRRSGSITSARWTRLPARTAKGTPRSYACSPTAELDEAVRAYISSKSGAPVYADLQPVARSCVASRQRRKVGGAATGRTAGNRKTSPTMPRCRPVARLGAGYRAAAPHSRGQPGAALWLRLIAFRRSNKDRDCHAQRGLSCAAAIITFWLDPRCGFPTEPRNRSRNRQRADETLILTEHRHRKRGSVRRRCPGGVER